MFKSIVSFFSTAKAELGVWYYLFLLGVLLVVGWVGGNLLGLFFTLFVVALIVGVVVYATVPKFEEWVDKKVDDVLK